MEACGLLATFMTFHSKPDTSLHHYQLLVHFTNVATWSTADVAALSGGTDVADLSATDMTDFRTFAVLPV